MNRQVLHSIIKIVIVTLSSSYLHSAIKLLFHSFTKLLFHQFIIFICVIKVLSSLCHQVGSCCQSALLINTFPVILFFLCFSLVTETKEIYK